MFQKNYPTACKRWQRSDKREKTCLTLKNTLLEMARTVRNIADVLANEKQLYDRESLLPVQQSTEILTTQVSDSARGENDSSENSSLV